MPSNRRVIAQLALVSLDRDGTSRRAWAAVVTIGMDFRITDLRSWTTALLTAVALVALGGAAGVAQAADPVYGVTAPSPLKARDYREMDTGGVQALRLEISWADTKRKSGALDWSRTDRRIRQAAEHDLEVVPYLTGRPNWVKPCHKGRCRAAAGPEQMDGWLRFVDTAVRRYGARGSFWPVGSRRVTLPVTTWQVWSTANKNVSPRSYGTLLEATYRTIKLADPDASVLTGGLSYGGRKKRAKPTRFLRGLLRSDGKNSFSGVAVGPQSHTVRQVKAQVKDVSRLLAETGHGNAGIWVTPIGWASDRGRSAMAVGRGGQKRRLRQSMSMLRRGLGVEGVFWSRWRDGGGGCSWCRHSGLVAASGKAKPAWRAYRKFLRKLSTHEPPPTDPGPSFFGVSPESGQLTSRDLGLMKQAGVGTVRFLVAKQSIAASDGSYDWDATDDTFRQLAAHDIEALPLLFGDPRDITRVSDPDVMQRWRAFVAAAVSRYRPGSPFWRQFAASHPGAAPLPPHVWQLYNEQNIWLYWPSGPSVPQFAKLLDVSADAIRRADPSAKIMLGGMLGEDHMNGIPSWDFLRQLYAIPGARDDFDIVAIHPYGFSLDDISWQVNNVREALAAANDSATPIWITEIGWGSKYDDDNSKTSWWERNPQGQADMLTSAWNMLLREREDWNIGGAFWYTWRDPGFKSCAFCESAGLLQNNFAPKPSFTAFRQLAATVRSG